MRARHIADAEQAYRLVIAISPTYVWAHCALAIVLIDSGRNEEALAERHRASDRLREKIYRSCDWPRLCRHRPDASSIAVAEAPRRCSMRSAHKWTLCRVAVHRLRAR